MKAYLAYLLSAAGAALHEAQGDKDAASAMIASALPASLDLASLHPRSDSVARRTPGRLKGAAHPSARDWRVSELMVRENDKDSVRPEVASDDDAYTLHGLGAVGEYLHSVLRTAHGDVELVAESGEVLDFDAIMHKLNNLRVSISRRGGAANINLCYTAPAMLPSLRDGGSAVQITKPYYLTALIERAESGAAVRITRQASEDDGMTAKHVDTRPNRTDK